METDRLNQLQIRVADSFFSRLRGLLFAPALTEKQGLLIRPCYSVHTLFMHYTIDVIFLDRAGNILKITHSLAPWRASACPQAWQTLELASGMAKQLKLQDGQSLSQWLSPP